MHSRIVQAPVGHEWPGRPVVRPGEITRRCQPGRVKARIQGLHLNIGIAVGITQYIDLNTALTPAIGIIGRIAFQRATTVSSNTPRGWIGDTGDITIARRAHLGKTRTGIGSIASGTIAVARFAFFHDAITTAIGCGLGLATQRWATGIRDAQLPGRTRGIIRRVDTPEGRFTGIDRA